MAQDNYEYYGANESTSSADGLRYTPDVARSDGYESSSVTHVATPSPHPRSSNELDLPRTSSPQDSTLVETGFDEGLLRTLCDSDWGVPLLLDRIKQSMISCREASNFLKKRAMIEEEYGKNLQKLARSTVETYGIHDGKAGSFVVSWHSSMHLHDQLAENKLRFAQRLNEMSEELSLLIKEVEKSRKQTKDLAARYERALQESESATDKAKSRLDVTTEELERVLLQKEGESFKDNPVQARPGGAGGKRAIGKAVAKGGMLLKGKNPANIQRQEEDVRQRMSSASDYYRKSLLDTQTLRQEYFNFQLPRILRTLKECNDEVDLGTQYHLTRYAFLFESTMLSDGSTLTPAPDEEGLSAGGLKVAIEAIDNRTDFKIFMQNYAYARGPVTSRGPRREGPQDEGFLPPIPNIRNNPSPSHTNGAPPPSPYTPDKGRPTFGVDLGEQMARDSAEIPPIMTKCCKAIEKHGLSSQGIYRISGTTSKVQELKQRLDKDMDTVDLDSPEWSSDVNNIASVLKLWLRELPDPLLTFSLRQGFMDAAKIESARLRHIRLHERVNDLPDPNYATLKYFLGHLYLINQHEADNSMTKQNLAIVFGPTLLGQLIPTPGSDPHMNALNGMNGMADATHQNMAIETILEHYKDIFVEE